MPWLYFRTMNVSVDADDFAAVGGFDEGFRSWGCRDYLLFPAEDAHRDLSA